MIELTQETYAEHIKSRERVLVDFWASWCEPCRAMTPVLEKVNAENLEVVKVNVDDEPDLATLNGVRSMPTLILFEYGEEVNRMIGAGPYNMVIDHFDL